jgi:hypothetical protein
MDILFAILPDDHKHPTAAFESLDEAIAWALAKYGSDRFSIRRMTPMEREAIEKRPVH